ncbi:MAG: hypothetical protein B9S34_03955 [Opitutia bacterium Tous-C1TDCM]|nr:MAG: hypothetical protein B9S34_03955 [Opitutae bacterium Tous-C1TDCM]
MERAAEWSGPGARAPRAGFSWAVLLWSLVYPQRGHRILPTIPGVILIALALGIGTAAYNSSSNILFITLSLLLACLILSGVLSWLNLRGTEWRLQLAPPLRAGHDAVVGLDLRNGKRFLPTYGLWFEFLAKPVDRYGPARAESTVTASGAEVKAALARAEAAERRGRVPQIGRLDPRGEGRVEWIVRPAERGRLRVELASVGSLFPFGFLRKDVGTEVRCDAIVWPAPTEYRRHALGAARRVAGGERVTRPGTGGDLLAVRRYTPGDSHRLIHWKASARTQTLLVRQLAAESAEGYSLWVRTEGGMWRRPEQFEVLVSLAATLAEDLFRTGRLVAVAIDGGGPLPVRRVHDLELFLDALAVLRISEQPFAPAPETGAAGAEPATGTPRGGRQQVITFVPDGVRGVAAYVDGQLAASA